MPSDVFFGLFALAGLILNLALQVVPVLIALVLWDRKMRGRAAPFARDRSMPSPLAILDARYARGEIDAAELQERRRVLRDEDA